MASGVQIELTPEFKGVLVVVPTNNLVAEWSELHSRSLVVGQTFGEELERTLAMVTKQKKELVEYANSLKATSEKNKALKDKILKDNVAAEKTKKTLKDELAMMEVEKAYLAKEKVATEEREKAFSTEVEECHAFMLHI